MSVIHPLEVARVRKVLEAADFAAHADEVLAVATPLIRLEPIRDQDRSYQSGKSWLGGKPSLPHDVDWPTWNPSDYLNELIKATEQNYSKHDANTPR